MLFINFGKLLLRKKWAEPICSFHRKFADFKTEADIRTVFETKDAARPALKNRLTELKRAHPNEFKELAELFRKRYPAYADIIEEL